MKATLQALLSLFLILVGSQASTAQQIVTSAPFQTLNNSFYEQTGINWSLRGPNFFANFGGPPLLPAFGGADPNAGLRTGFAFQRGGISGSLGLSLAQGSNRSSVSTTPSVTTMNGVPGNISSQTISPFVTGITPVVGGYSYGNPTQDNVSTQMFQSHQASQAAYLQSRLNANARAKQERADRAFERAVRADEQGNLKMARANYRIALGADQGVLRQQILLRMKARGWTK
ncbi:MAG: hypothetical protein AAFX06_23885 [Planctomycetota bacterium]